MTNNFTEFADGAFFNTSMFCKHVKWYLCYTTTNITLLGIDGTKTKLL